MDSNSYKHIYIVGAGHSGSTLLDIVLGSHEKALSLGEINNFDQVVKGNKVCTCGKGVKNCNFWSKIINQYYESNGGPTDLRAQSKSGVTKFLHQFFAFLILKIPFKIPLSLYRIFAFKMFSEAENSVELLQIIHQYSRKKYYVESSKSPLRMLLIYLTGKTDMKIIYLTRDGRAVSGSRTKRKKAKYLPIPRKAKKWVLANKYSLASFKYIDKTDYIHIQYEALCRDTENTLNKLSRFIGLTNKLSADNIFSNKNDHTFAGNPIRFNGEFKLKEDVKWRERFTSDDLKAFNNIGYTLNKQLLEQYFEE